MNPNVVFAPSVFFAALALGSASNATQVSVNAQEERVAVAHMLVLGQQPSANELSEWQGQETLTLEQILAKARQRLRDDRSLERQVTERSFQDAYGRDMDAEDRAELEDRFGDDHGYTRAMKHHIDWLAVQPDEYERVINRAYRFVIQRDAYAEEIEYWTERETLSYVLLVGCIEDWARRNQPGLMVTAGTPTISINCPYLTTMRLSPAIAAEARRAVDLAQSGGEKHYIVAAGADRVVSEGGIHFALVGGMTRSQ